MDTTPTVLLKWRQTRFVRGRPSEGTKQRKAGEREKSKRQIQSRDSATLRPVFPATPSPIFLLFTQMDLMKVDVLDPHPDIHDLFCYYNALYFDDTLGACMVTWSSGRMTLCAGTCCYIGNGCCEIRLSEPLLKFRSSVDLKNTLLHEMIHAYLFVKYKSHDHGYHGNEFQKLMKEINCSTVVDYQRPPGGYSITIYHNFYDEVNSYRVHHWMCKNCGDLVKRAVNREPSANDCIQRVKTGQGCNHPSCHWHSHERLCNGSYEKIAEPSGYQRKRSKRREGNHGTNTTYSKALDGKDNKNTEKNRSGAEAAVKKENLDLLKYNTLEKFYRVLKNEPEAEKRDSSCGEGLPMVNDLDELGEIGKHSGTSKREHPRNNRRPVNASKSTNNFVSDQKWRSSSWMRKQHKEQNIYTVIIRWKGWYAYEEDSDSSEPLIDKRTERKKKLKGDWNDRNWLLPRAEVAESDDLELTQYSKGSAEESTVAEHACSLNHNNGSKSDARIPSNHNSSGSPVQKDVDNSHVFAVVNQPYAVESIAGDYAEGVYSFQPGASLSLESCKAEQAGLHPGARSSRARHLSVKHGRCDIVDIADSGSDAE